MSEPTKELPSLWQHQKEAIIKATNRFALFFDPGCGKSRTAIELYKKSRVEQDRDFGTSIIFAPLNVCRNWQHELDEYLGLGFRTWLVAGQPRARKQKILKDFAACKDPIHKFLICNIESLRSLDYRGNIISSFADFIIVDESHNFKTPASQQTKGLINIIEKLKPTHLYLLTGTPAPQGEIDLWSTFTLLKKTNDNFFIWRKKYFFDKNERRRGTKNYWPEYVISAQGKEYFQKLLSECSVSANKNLVLDLPELLRTVLYAPMSAQQAQHYETMKEFLFAIDKEGNELNASNMLSRTLRLQQILAGFLADTEIAHTSRDSNGYVEHKNPRLETLKDAIQMTKGEPFLIWTIFKATYKQLADTLDDLGISFGFLTGEQTAEERFKYMEDFQAGKLRALIAHPKAGGVGVNLTAASYSIHYTRSFSLTDDLQAEARNYRGGSEIHKRITRIDIITPDTIDEDIAAALKSKKSVQDFILGLKEKRYGKAKAASAA